LNFACNLSIAIWDFRAVSGKVKRFYLNQLGLTLTFLCRLLTHQFIPLILIIVFTIFKNSTNPVNLRCMNMRNLWLIVLLVVVVSIAGCTAPKIRLFPSQADPLKEQTLKGKANQKILVIPIRGIISDAPKKGFVRTRPSIVQEVVSQLRLAEKDKRVKALILKIDSPGGTVTGSDILYKEILDFKDRTGVTLVAAMMGVAASGAYQIALPSDYILAHPTTITGSIGAIMVRPRVTGLMQKVGLGVDVNKSGENKDMGSPFREPSPEEKQILQDLIAKLGGRFVALVSKHRQLEPATVSEISKARVYLADEALQLGLVDDIGYLEKAVQQAKKLAGLPEDAKLVVYRRTAYPDDNIYNTATRYGGGDGSLISLELPGSLGHVRTGFYYLWPAAAMSE
jgi:protease-4